MRLITALVAFLAVLLPPTAQADPPAERAAASASPAGIPRTYDDAVAHFEEAGGDIRPMKRFILPSGNIYCKISFGRPQGCEIDEGAIKDPAACSGNPVTKYVGRMEFIRGRATPICNTDTIRTPGAKVLPYGAAAKVRGSSITCLSEAIGVTCINLAKTEGFFLHRGEYVTFNAG